MSKVNVGIIGFGTVGAGTVEILLENRDIISNRVGSEIIIKRIADLDIHSDRGIPIEKGVLTTNALEIIDDSHIEIVVELMGGLEQAKDYILMAMERGKHVVTANKALLAEYGSQIYQAADKFGVSLTFEASVAGGIPLIRAIKVGLVANRIRSVTGIINGTCNYVLSRMSAEKLPFGEALATAQEIGYAEADPAMDAK